MPNASTSDLEALLKRVEKARAPTRDLDLAIIRAVLPTAVVLRHNEDTGANEPYTYWKPTSSLDACHALQEQVLPGAYVEISGPRKCLVPDGWCVVVVIGDRDCSGWGSAPELAWLAAILTALIA